MSSDPNAEQETSGGSVPDDRLYVCTPDGWTAHVKHGWEKQYCYAQKPGDDFFHLLMSGEIYVQHGNEKYCLDCALRNGALTRDRLHWKHEKKASGTVTRSPAPPS